MVNLVVVGGQWGDEGKGKVVDLLCPAFCHVVRFNGGNNAGHTVRFGERRFALHLVPSGILHEGCRCAIGPGVVVDPVGLRTELATLEAEGISARQRLVVSPRAHLVLPGHKALDAAREAARGSGRIGTTGRGIGPAYETRAARLGVRAGQTRDRGRFRAAVAALGEHLARLATLHADVEPPGSDEVEEAIAAALEITPLLADVSVLLGDAAARDEPILFEGAQGTFLDIDRGSYPYVTSSSCLAGFAAPACGLSPRTVGGVLVVLKAYTTRVGGGPFPTEIGDAVGDHLRERGNEFGTTTGRPRRIGWFDAVAARTAVRWNGVDAVALTKLDVLDGLDELRIAVAYRLGDSVLDRYPDDVEELAAVEPVWDTLPGWLEPSVGVTEMEALPARARAYVARLEQLLGVPVVLISTGPRREETVVRRIPPLADWGLAQ